MNTHFHFKKQLDDGAREMFFYGLEREPEQEGRIVASIMRHKGTLDSFPTNLEFVRMMTESTPLFKEVA
jgi:hypothetical protein